MSRSAEFSPPPPLADLSRAFPLALFLDFDGTLVELAPTPDAIAVPSGLADRLARLAERLEGRLALVSGRALEDIERHLPGICVARAGSHGAARKLDDGNRLGEDPQGLSDATVDALRSFAKTHDLLYEAKTHGGALHYRSAPGRADRILAFAESLAAKHDLTVKTGKCVVELVRPGADKGGAVRAFMATSPFAGAQPWFVGDDVTDEDGFAACVLLGGGGVLVGDRTPTGAHFALANVAQTLDWLGL